MYGAQNRVAIPIGHIQEKQFNYVVFFHQTPSSGHKYDHGLMSLLYLEGFLRETSGEAFYCPSELDPQQMYDTDVNPWILRPTNPPHRHLHTTTPAGDLGDIGHCRFAYNTRPCADWFRNAAYAPLVNTNKAKNGHLYAKPYLIAEKKFAFPTSAGLKGKAILADALYYKDAVLLRHKKGINVLYADGSGKWVALSVFDKNTNYPVIGKKYSDVTGIANTWNSLFLEESTSSKATGVWAELDEAR